MKTIGYLESELAQVRSDLEHALKYSGKYAAGYNRGLSRRQADVRWYVEQRETLRDVLKAVDEWNDQMVLMPPDLRATIKQVLWGE